MSNPTNPNNPQGSFQPPWLAKLNAASEQVEKAISHTPIEIETKTETPVANPIQPHVSVPEEIPPDIYDAVIQSDSAGNNVVKPVGARLEFNAAEFAQAIGRGSRAEADVEVGASDAIPTPDGISEDGGLIEFKTVSVDPDYRYADNSIQSFGKLGAKSLYYDGPGEEDGPWAPGWAERCGSHGSPELDADAAKLEAMAGEGAAGPTFWDLQTPNFQSVSEAMLPDDQIPGMPTDWKTPVAVDLPEVVDVESKNLVQPASSVVDYVSADNDQPVVSEEEYYAAIVAQLRPSNPTEAKLIARLRLFQSQYVGLITTPEQAIDHIAQCRRDNTPIGGSDAVELSAQSTSLKHKQYIERRYAPHKLKREAVEAARKGWKDAIAQKEAAMKQWDSFVKWHHDNYAQLRKMPVESFQSQQGGESDAQSD